MTNNVDAVEVNEILIDGLKQRIYNEIKEKLLKGEDYEIPGVGVMKVHSRRIRSQSEDQDDNNFAIIVKIEQNKEFSKNVRSLYEKNPENFSNNRII